MSVPAMQPKQPWGADGPTVLVGERDAAGRVPASLPRGLNRSNPNFLSELFAELEADRAREAAAGASPTG